MKPKQLKHDVRLASRSCELGSEFKDTYMIGGVWLLHFAGFWASGWDVLSWGRCTQFTLNGL